MLEVISNVPFHQKEREKKMQNSKLVKIYECIYPKQSSKQIFTQNTYNIVSILYVYVRIDLL